MLSSLRRSPQLEGRSVFKTDLCPVSSRLSVPTSYSVYVFLFEPRGVACHFIPLQSSAGGTKCIKHGFVPRLQPSRRSDLVLYLCFPLWGPWGSMSLSFLFLSWGDEDDWYERVGGHKGIAVLRDNADWTKARGWTEGWRGNKLIWNGLGTRREILSRVHVEVFNRGRRWGLKRKQAIWKVRGTKEERCLERKLWFKTTRGVAEGWRGNKLIRKLFGG